MSVKPKILVVSDCRGQADPLSEQLAEAFDTVSVQSMIRALARLSREEFAGVFVCSAHLKDAFQVGRLLQNERILQGMPDGVVLLDAENNVVWGNERVCQWSGQANVVGANFYALLGSPEILGPDYCPFHSALESGQSTSSTLRAGDNRYYRMHATPVLEAGEHPRHLIVTIRDITGETLQQQKLAAIHAAGIELADLKPEDLRQMSVEERIELLKSNILHYTKDLLSFDVVEVRLLDRKTDELKPLLAEGMRPEAMHRALFAQPQGNGVTGYVAATGKSYLCENTTSDPLYLEGAAGAKSSLTVPLMWHDEVIGTFNVESPEPEAFSESDLQFLEIFGRDVAAALNTLDLLTAEKAETTQASVEAIHGAVALPIDDILNEAVNIMERYIGHQPEVTERLERILRNARTIKQVIQKVGQTMAPVQAVPQAGEAEQRPLLRGRTILVADADESVRVAAHALLERYGCTIETAHNGAEAIYMVRNMLRDGGYDAVLADIRLPDMSGYDFLVKLKELMEHVPLVLMTGFGYDPGHSIVKARQAGLQANAVLFKPFRLDQLLTRVEETIRARPEAPSPAGA